ncbi:MAG: hypothetical protein JNM57_11805 [Cyclobacteriaceae bacterium]|nr:hypothetical protein [Cyclobacteriaceae bacterium]
MRKYLAPVVSLLVVSACCVVFSSCKDDEPFVKPKLSFKLKTQTVKESDGTIEVELILDKPAPEDIIIDYSLDGTALDKVAAGSNGDYDYEILGDYLEVEILKGETSGFIQLKLYSDLDIEDPEKIEIQIEDVDNDKIEITRDDLIKITVEQEDGIIVFLSWPAPTPSLYADMDLLVRVGETTAAWDGILTGSIQEGNQPGEFVFIPKALGNLAFGLSYVYYSGTLDPLDFTATFIELKDGVLEPVAQREVFTASYTLANINVWDTNGINTTQVVQSFQIAGGNYTNITPISVPASGSRTSVENFIPTTLKRTRDAVVTPEVMKALLNR